MSTAAGLSEQELWLQQNAIACRRFSAQISPTTCDHYQVENLEACRGCERMEKEPSREETLAARRKRWSAPKKRKESESTGEETSMAKKRTCADCGREMKIIGRGLCGRCYYQHKKAGSLDRFKPRGPVPPRKTGGQKGSGARTRDKSPAAAGQKQVVQGRPIALPFEDERDKELLQRIMDLARVERRSVEAQCLVLIEKAMEVQA